MKKIKYEILQNIITDDDTKTSTPILAMVELPWAEAAEELAKTEAYKGEYTVYDDGEPEPEAEMSAAERIAALEAKLAALGV